jgi:hypothetical protein
MDNERAFRELEIKVTKTGAFVRGALAVGTILLGAIQFYALHELKGIDDRTARITTVERQVAVLEADIAFLSNFCRPAPPTPIGPGHR